MAGAYPEADLNIVRDNFGLSEMKDSSGKPLKLIDNNDSYVELPRPFSSPAIAQEAVDLIEGLEGPAYNVASRKKNENGTFSARINASKYFGWDHFAAIRDMDADEVKKKMGTKLKDMYEKDALYKEKMEAFAAKFEAKLVEAHKPIYETEADAKVASESINANFNKAHYHWNGKYYNTSENIDFAPVVNEGGQWKLKLNAREIYHQYNQDLAKTNEIVEYVGDWRASFVQDAKNAEPQMDYISKRIGEKIERVGATFSVMNLSDLQANQMKDKLNEFIPGFAVDVVKDPKSKNPDGSPMYKIVLDERKIYQEQEGSDGYLHDVLIDVKSLDGKKLARLDEAKGKSLEFVEARVLAIKQNTAPSLSAQYEKEAAEALTQIKGAAQNAAAKYDAVKGQIPASDAMLADYMQRQEEAGEAFDAARTEVDNAKRRLAEAKAGKKASPSNPANEAETDIVGEPVDGVYPVSTKSNLPEDAAKTSKAKEVDEVALAEAALAAATVKLQVAKDNYSTMSKAENDVEMNNLTFKAFEEAAKNTKRAADEAQKSLDNMRLNFAGALDDTKLSKLDPKAQMAHMESELANAGKRMADIKVSQRRAIDAISPIKDINKVTLIDAKELDKTIASQLAKNSAPAAKPSVTPVSSSSAMPIPEYKPEDNKAPQLLPASTTPAAPAAAPAAPGTPAVAAPSAPAAPTPAASAPAAAVIAPAAAAATAATTSPAPAAGAPATTTSTTSPAAPAAAGAAPAKPEEPAAPAPEPEKPDFREMSSLKPQSNIINDNKFGLITGLGTAGILTMLGVDGWMTGIATMVMTVLANAFVDGHGGFLAGFLPESLVGKKPPEKGLVMRIDSPDKSVAYATVPLGADGKLQDKAENVAYMVQGVVSDDNRFFNIRSISSTTDGTIKGRKPLGPDGKPVLVPVELVKGTDDKGRVTYSIASDTDFSPIVGLANAEAQKRSTPAAATAPAAAVAIVAPGATPGATAPAAGTAPVTPTPPVDPEMAKFNAMLQNAYSADMDKNGKVNVPEYNAGTQIQKDAIDALKKQPQNTSATDAIGDFDLTKVKTPTGLPAAAPVAGAAAPKVGP